jgi:ABC-2 type transport system ATP-binding protein
MSEIDGAAVVLEQLTVRYGRKAALDNVSLSVPRGSVYALLGRNGAGKSSAVRCLLGHQRPTQGQVLLFGNDAWKYRARAMEKVGIVPEEPNAPPEMTPKQITSFCSRLYKSWDSQGVGVRLRRFGVPLETPFGQLSKGQKGQVMLALALGQSPDLLVLDDPTLGLDVVARKEFFEELIGELADHGTTVLITTHDLSGVEGIASRVGILKQGRLVVNEEIEALKGKFRRIRYLNRRVEMRHEYGGELDALSALQVTVGNWGVEAIVSNFDDRCYDRFRRTEGVVNPEVVPMSLEEIFSTVVSDREGE